MRYFRNKLDVYKMQAISRTQKERSCALVSVCNKKFSSQPDIPVCQDPEKMFCAEHAKDIARISTARYSPDVIGMLSMLLSQSRRNANVFLMYMIGGRKSQSAYFAYEMTDMFLS